MHICNYLHKISIPIIIFLLAVLLLLSVGCSKGHSELVGFAKEADQSFGRYTALCGDYYCYIDCQSDAKTYGVVLNDKLLHSSKNPIQGLALSESRIAFCSNERLFVGKIDESAISDVLTLDIGSFTNSIFCFTDDNTIMLYTVQYHEEKFLSEKYYETQLYIIDVREDGLKIVVTTDMPTSLADSEIFESINENGIEYSLGVLSKEYEYLQDAFVCIDNKYFGRGLIDYYGWDSCFAIKTNDNETIFIDNQFVFSNQNDLILEIEGYGDYSYVQSVISVNENIFIILKNKNDLNICALKKDSVDIAKKIEGNIVYIGSRGNKIIYFDRSNGVVHQMDLLDFTDETWDYDCIKESHPYFELCGNYLYIQHENKTCELLPLD